MICGNCVCRSGRNPSRRASNRNLGSRTTTTTSGHHCKLPQDGQIFDRLSKFKLCGLFNSSNTVSFSFLRPESFAALPCPQKKAHTSKGFPSALLVYWDLPAIILGPIYACLLQDQNAWGSVVERNSVAFFAEEVQHRQTVQDRQIFPPTSPVTTM